jgi:hypothetical protein
MIRTRFVMLIALFLLSACGSNGLLTTAPQNSEIEQTDLSAPSTAQATTAPSDTPVPEPTATAEPPTPEPTQPGGQFIPVFTQYLQTNHSVEVGEWSVEDGTVSFEAKTSFESADTIRLTAYQMVRSFSNLSIYGEDEDILADITGTENYSIEMLVFSADESTVFYSLTGKDAIDQIRADQSFGYSDWAELADAELR